MFQYLQHELKKTWYTIAMVRNSAVGFVSD